MANVNRRSMLSLLAGLFAGVVALGSAEPAAAQRRPVRPARRRVRRRIRRHVAFRMVGGRRVWIAPVALAIGWELALENNRVVVVKETRFVERSGARVEVVVVQGSDGKTEELEIVREDNAENGKDLEGSVLADSDKTTPGIEKEEDVDAG